MNYRNGSDFGPITDQDAESFWFKAETFLDPNFNPEAYVSDIKRYVPLDELRARLTAHADTLRYRLVEVVNEDYDEFASLSTKLVDVNGAVARIEQPLVDVRDRITLAKAEVMKQSAALHDGLERRQAAAAARSLLELAQDAIHVVAKVEKLLSEVPPGVKDIGNPRAVDEAAQEELDSRGRLLDRLCSEMSRLNFYLARGEEVAVVRSLAPRVQRAAKTLHASLDSVLEVVLVAQNPTALGLLLHAYGSIGRTEAAENIVRRVVVAPIVDETVKALDLSVIDSSARGPDGEPKILDGGVLSVFLPAVESALRSQAGPFLQLSMNSSGGLALFDFLGGAVLTETLATIDKNFPGAYSPGFPDAFHSNYRASVSFLDALEAFCMTIPQLERFRTSAAFRELKSHWNLAAYFSLRYQEIASTLEEALEGSKLEKNPPGGRYKYAVTTAVATAARACSAPSVVLPPLCDRFLRLALQIPSRFSTWIRQGVEDLRKGNSDNHGTFGREPTVEELAAFWQDVNALKVEIMSEILPRLLRLIAEEPSEAITVAFADADVVLTGAGEVALHAAASGIVDRCCEALKQLRGILATFRMTTRAAPTRAAQYASLILVPLQHFLASDGAGALDSNARLSLVRSVVDGVAMRYRDLAHETLSTVRKTESSLRRLKSRKEGIDAGTGVPASGGHGTDELITQQLRLDIEEFGHKLSELGLDVAGLDTYEALRTVLESEENIQDGTI